MKIVILKIAIVFLNIIYFVMKLFPTKKKITFISRQGNQAPLDFLLLKEGLEHQLQEYQIVLLSKKLTQQDNIIIKIKYCFHIIRQMYHIATSKLVILDSYCIPVCLLHHKKELKVIQMWHSVGTMKKFGYSVLDKKEGSK